MLKKTRAFVFAALLTVSVLPLLSSPASAVGASSGTLFAVFGGATVVSIDPGTGARSTIADFSVPTPPGVALTDLVSDATGHRLFSQLRTFSFDPTLPTTYQLVTINTQTHASSVAPTLEDSLSFAWDPSTGTLYGLTLGSPFEIFKIDTNTGAETPFAGPLPGVDFSNMAIGPAAHTIYLSSRTPGVFPPTAQVVTVDAATGAVTPGPNESIAARTLVYDASAGLLFARTFCCPVRIIQLDPGTGTGTYVGTFDLGFGGNSLTVDSGSHTLYSMEDVLGIFGFNQFVATIGESGSISLSAAIPLTGYISGLAFEAPAVTADSIKADVRSALASGAIDNHGIANSLLVKLDHAATARAHGDCAGAARNYKAFINEVNAQSGKHVAAATAAKLVGEAQFLIANCP
jgi:hypothetical protein